MIELLEELRVAFGETATMVSIATLCALLLGLPLGVAIYVTSRQLFLQNRTLYLLATVSVNIIRSVPFVILLVLLLPLTHWVLGTTIGPVAAAMPMAVAGIAFYARMTDSALREIDPGIVEAAEAFGASPLRIILTVLLPEAVAGLLRGLTITLVSLIGYSAMAGIVGGGGVGDLAIRFGYYRYETTVMVLTVIALVVLVQVVQTAGDWAASRVNRR